MIPVVEKEYPLTKWLIIINVMVYIILAFLTGSILSLAAHPILLFVAQFNAFVYRGLIYELFTSLFVHFDILHLLMNMFFLYILGRQFEVSFSKRDYIIVYFVGGLVGNIFTLVLGPYVLSGGASGAIFSMYAFVITVFYKRQRQSLKSVIYLLILMLLINMGFQSNFLAHAGGALFGLLYGLYYLRKFRVSRRGFYIYEEVTY